MIIVFFILIAIEEDRKRPHKPLKRIIYKIIIISMITYPAGKIAEKAVWRSVFLTI